MIIHQKIMKKVKQKTLVTIDALTRQHNNHHTQQHPYNKECPHVLIHTATTHTTTGIPMIIVVDNLLHRCFHNIFLSYYIFNKQAILAGQSVFTVIIT